MSLSGKRGLFLIRAEQFRAHFGTNIMRPEFKYADALLSAAYWCSVGISCVANLMTFPDCTPQDTATSAAPTVLPNDRFSPSITLFINLQSV